MEDGVINMGGVTLPDAQHPARQKATRSAQRAHQDLCLRTLMACASQAFIRPHLALAGHRQVLGQELWQLTQGRVDGIGTFHEVAEARQVGLNRAFGGCLAQGPLRLKQVAVVAAKEDRRVGQIGNSQFPDELLP
jgi:hypothetical protein